MKKLINIDFFILKYDNKIKIIFLSLLFLYSLYCALQLGHTWDVMFYYGVGKERLDYLFSLGSNKVNDLSYSSRFATGAYSTISAFFVQFFPRRYNLESIYFINLIFSIITIFGIYKLTKEFFNKHIGQITFVICFLNPIFFGHMAMNGMDTIITFVNVWIFYVIIKYFKKQHIQDKKNNYVIYCGLLLGLGLGVRPSIIITLIPILLFAILEMFYFKIYVQKIFSKKIFFIDFLKVILIAYFFMVLFWTHTHPNIFLLPFKLVFESFSFGFGTPFILFNGTIFNPGQLPSYYILLNLFYKMPEFYILSFFLFILFFYKMNFYFKNNINGYYFKIFTLFFIILFPNFLLAITPIPIYDGLRLFLFLIPYICIIPSILIFFLFKNLKNNLYKFLFVFLIFMKIFFLFNFLSLTPYHYVYLNFFAGEYSKNLNKFENDYWGVSTKKLISSIKHNKVIFNDSKIKILVCGVPADIQKKYLNKINNLNYEIVGSEEDFDFVIMTNRVMLDKDNINYDPKVAKTCFDKHKGEDIIKIERRGLVISKITKV